MKFFGCILLILTSFAQAEEAFQGPEQLGESNFNTSSLRKNKTAMKAGIAFHGFNSGTTYISILASRDLGRSFTMGIEGMIPTEQDEAIQLYIGRAFGQVNLLNSAQRRIAWSFSAALLAGEESFFNSSTNSTFSAGLGSSIGFTHKFRLEDQTDFGVTASAGIDYLAIGVSSLGLDTTASFYSNFGLSASYFF